MDGALGKIKLRTSDSLPDIQDIKRSGLKMRGGIIRFGDEDLFGNTIGDGFEDILDDHEAVQDFGKQANGEFDFLDGVGGFNGRGDGSDTEAIGTDLVVGRDERDVCIVVALGGLLGDDDLGGVGILGVGESALENVDAADNLADLLDLVGEVGRVAEDELGLDELAIGSHTNEPSIRGIFDALELAVQHVGTAVDGRETGEGLREFAETVQRIDVGGFEVASKRLKVEADLVEGGTSGLLEVSIITVQREGVADEIASARGKAEMFVDGGHVDLLEIHAFVGLAVGGVELGDEIHELASTVLLEQAHETRTHGLTRSSGDFVNTHIFSDNKASIDLLELKIFGGIC